MCDYKYVEELIVAWAKDRKIIPNATPASQLLKMVSEVGELADAENHGDDAAIRDAVGDIMVCLINYSKLKNIDIVDCMVLAYEEIKHRRGTLLPNGVFLREK